ncbi:MAG: hypothetical protein HY291_23405 [Planctomycetes bacterium]|nr:hypothetical protein [Planctomycetota bacterium]
MPGILPPALRAKLEALRPSLEVQGVLQQRVEPDRSAAWRIRYRNRDDVAGVRRHRSLPLGQDEGVARAAWALVEGWRKDRRRFEEEQDAKLEAERRHRKTMKACRRMAVLVGGGGYGRQRRNAKEFDAATTGTPLDAMRWLITSPFMRPNRRPGRPKKARLW